MKMNRLAVKVLSVAMVFILICALFPDTEAKPSKGSRDRAEVKSQSRKRNSGGSNHGSWKKPKSAKRYMKLKFPYICETGKSQRRASIDDGSSQSDMQFDLLSTTGLLQAVEKSLQALLDEMTFNETIPLDTNFAIQELNPTNTIKLASDEKFKFLGQMTYWMNWIEVSLRFIDERGIRLEPLNPGKPNTNHLYAAKQNSQKLLKSLSFLRTRVNFSQSRKGKNVLKCRKAKFVKIADSSNERRRIYVIIRDAIRAVGKMFQALNDVDPQSFLARMERSVFYNCLKFAYDIKGRRKMCLRWQ